MATLADFTRIGNYAQMYNPDENINRIHSTRTVPLQLLCLGMSRSGTLTMNKAASILGYPSPYHFSSQLSNISDCDNWSTALEAKYWGKGPPPDKKFFDGMLGHCGAVTDAPCILFARELVEMYPEAKVVLWERDEEKWLKSWLGLCEAAFGWGPWFASIIDPGWAGRVGRLGWFATEVSAGFGRSVREARVRSVGAYRSHLREVREVTPKERLLEFSLADGWGPLCEFLGKPVPVSL